MAEADVLMVDVVVASFQLQQQTALLALAVAAYRSVPDIVCQHCGYQTVLAEVAEHSAELRQVFAKQGIGFTFRQWQSFEFLTLQHSMAIAHVWVYGYGVGLLEVLDYPYRSLEWRQVVDALRFRL